jgi:catechol 2,3-dioxygenase-like lactoylglutathione lyase family enzyme
MTLQRMDNVLVVVDDLEAAKAFFVELGMELEGETTVEGSSVDRLISLQNVRATLALMRLRTATDGSSWTSSTRPKRS